MQRGRGRGRGAKRLPALADAQEAARLQAEEAYDRATEAFEADDFYRRWTAFTPPGGATSRSTTKASAGWEDGHWVTGTDGRTEQLIRRRVLSLPRAYRIFEADAGPLRPRLQRLWPLKAAVGRSWRTRRRPAARTRRHRAASRRGWRTRRRRAAVPDGAGRHGAGRGRPDGARQRWGADLRARATSRTPSLVRASLRVAEATWREDTAKTSPRRCASSTTSPPPSCASRRRSSCSGRLGRRLPSAFAADSDSRPVIFVITHVKANAHHAHDSVAGRRRCRRPRPVTVTAVTGGGRDEQGLSSAFQADAVRRSECLLDNLELQQS